MDFNTSTRAHKTHLFFLLFLAAGLGACSSMDGSRKVLKFQNDVTVIEAGGSKTAYKKGDTLPVPLVPTHIEAPGYIGMLVVPSSSGTGEIDVSLKNIEEFGGPQFNRELNARLNEVVARVVEAQKMLASGKARDALGVIENLQDKNSELTYLNFLKASCLVVLGERARARTALEDALASFPDNEAGRSLAAQIGVEAPTLSAPSKKSRRKDETE